MKALARAELEIKNLKVRIVEPHSAFSQHNLPKQSTNVNSMSSNTIDTINATHVSSSSSLANLTDSSDSFNISIHSADFRDANFLASEDVETGKKDNLEIQRLVSLVTSLTQSNLRLTKELEEKDKKSAVLTFHSPTADTDHQSLSEVKNENLRLQATIHVQQKSHEVLQRKNAELLERISKQAVLYEQVSDLQRKQVVFSSLENELSFSKARVVYLENSLQAWIRETQELIALDSTHDHKDPSNVDTTSPSQPGVTAADLSRAFHVLRENLASATISNDMISSQMRVLESRFQTTRKDKEDLQQQVQSLILEKTKLENERKDLQKILASNTTEIATLNELIDTERDFFSDLRAQKRQKMTGTNEETRASSDLLSSSKQASPQKSLDIYNDRVNTTTPEQEQTPTLSFPLQQTKFFEFGNAMGRASNETQSLFGESLTTSLFPFSQSAKPLSSLPSSGWMDLNLMKEKEKDSTSIFSSFSLLSSASSSSSSSSQPQTDSVDRSSLEFTPSSFGFTFGK